MSVKESYNIWSEQYDTGENKTRDLEAISLHKTLLNYSFEKCLEVGCGTGKNTEFLITKSKKITSVDLSEKMLNKAEEKIKNKNVEFKQADITEPWNFSLNKFDLITFSLVLEHIEDLDFIFQQIDKKIDKNGFVYISELHPFKQYNGTKARFETKDGLHIIPCFNHHISDFTSAAFKYDFEIVKLDEFFDDDNKKSIPRIITFLLKK